MVKKNNKNKKIKALKKKPTKVTKPYKTKPKANDSSKKDYYINMHFTEYKDGKVNTEISTLGFDRFGKKANQFMLTYLCVGFASVAHNFHIEPSELGDALEDFYSSFKDNGKEKGDK